MKRIVIAVLVLALAALFFARQRHQIRSLQRASGELAGAIETVRQKAAALLEENGVLREELDALVLERDSIGSRLPGLVAEVAAREAGTDWSHPPATLPGWNPGSPYVWIEKAMLPRFGIRPFSTEGQLYPEASGVLAMTPEQVDVLNRTVRELLAEFRTHEAARAVPSEEHLPGIEQAEGRKVTVVLDPMPEVSASLRQRFEATVLEQLGEQRSGLLLSASRGWMQDQFGWVTGGSGVVEPEPRVYSVVRRPDGRYAISIRSGFGWLSTSGIPGLDDHVPVHLRHLFMELMSD